MISAINDRNRRAGDEAGAYHYITKGFRLRQLRSLVRNASERQT
jgi:DNA-binding response OmpR family regulator